ncbi:MAG: hydroxysqualene dehydroxylase HpnE [Sulfuricella denitrificans]|nr:hydroxysqualene dehydroxylase HpnE [Sulfuricella denitrificans]
MAERLKRVGIIGAGYAGIAAAVRLADGGIPVTLFEAGRVLGGRARGVDHQGIRLDNGQHMLLGAYRDTLEMMDRVGVRDAMLRLPLSLSIPGRFALKTPALPAPFHLLLGLLNAQGLPFGERLSAIRFALRLRLMNFRLPQDISVACLLARHRQGGNISRLLWEPLCLAALNTPIDQASAQVFLNVLRDSFSHARSDSDMLLPRSDLSALLPDAAAKLIRGRNGEIRTGCRVHRIESTESGFDLHWPGGSENFSHVICATAPQHALPLLAGLPALAPARESISSMSYQPIATIYLQYPEQVRLPQAMLGMSEGWAQWVFDRGWTHGTAGLLAVVISAEGRHQDVAPEQMAERVAEELTLAFGLPQALWHKVIMEKRATFACTAGVARPDQKTGLKNFYLAGDYTAGDYPATIEGAVRSGVKCAGLVSGSLSPA